MRQILTVMSLILITACSAKTLPQEELRAQLVGRLDAQGITNIHVEPIEDDKCDLRHAASYSFTGVRIDDITKSEMYGFVCMDARNGEIHGISVMTDRTFQ